jgi:GMC oxidoreductase
MAAQLTKYWEDSKHGGKSSRRLMSTNITKKLAGNVALVTDGSGDAMNLGDTDSSARSEDFSQRVRVNQTKLISELKPHYDFIVCGSGSSGSAVAGRLAENPDIDVLLLENGGTDETESITNPNRWPMTLGTELDWGFVVDPNPHLKGRAIPYSMGKVLEGAVPASMFRRGLVGIELIGTSFSFALLEGAESVRVHASRTQMVA